jgi:hypothetical protein
MEPAFDENEQGKLIFDVDRREKLMSRIMLNWSEAGEISEQIGFDERFGLHCYPELDVATGKKYKNA